MNVKQLIFPLVPSISFSLSPENCLLSGTVIQLQCVVRRLPEPRIQFKRNNESVHCLTKGSCNVSVSLEDMVTTSTLTFFDPKPADEGI